MSLDQETKELLRVLVGQLGNVAKALAIPSIHDAYSKTSQANIDGDR